MQAEGWRRWKDAGGSHFIMTVVLKVGWSISNQKNLKKEEVDEDEKPMAEISSSDSWNL